MIIEALCSRIIEISSVTQSDYIEIVSSFISISNTEYSCIKCKARHRDPERAKTAFKQKACTFINENPVMRYQATNAMNGCADITYNTCPSNFVDGGTVSLINLIYQYEKGIMPYTGGLLEQPAKLVETMDLVHNLMNEHQQAKEEHIKKNKR